MYLKKSKQKNGRTFLSIVDGYYDKEKKYARTKTIESIGYLEDFIDLYDDPILHFQKRVDELKSMKIEQMAPITLTFSPNELIDPSIQYQKNLGYAALSSVYHKLGIHSFFKNRQRHSKESYDADAIMRLLTYSRLLYPDSKKSTYENKNYFFDKFDFSLDDVYRSLSLFYKHKEALQAWLNEKIKKHYNRDTSLVYYDVTNFYFETDDPDDDFRKKGVSKEHRPNPIVQMGLFMDNNGIPITYELFPGNTNDCLTFRPNFKRIKKEYELGRVITVADKGMNTGDNIWYTVNTPDKDGYVFSMSVRGATKALKRYVLDEEDYVWFGNDYKCKSRLEPRTINVTTTTGKKMKKVVDEKQVVFYSEKYAKRAKAERAAAIAKAQEIANDPGRFTRATSHGAVKYVKKIDFDKETGEILTASSVLELNEELLRAEEELDGYYVIITSEMDESDQRIIEMYRGLWKIEESFRITKSDLEARPVYVSKKEHIDAHFLTCYIALIIIRILEIETHNKYSAGKILESIRRCDCTYAQQNYYLCNYNDEIINDLGGVLGIDFKKRIHTLGEIKKILAATKKG